MTIEKFGDVQVCVLPKDAPSLPQSADSSSDSVRPFDTASISETVKESLKEVVTAIARDFAIAFAALESKHRPKEVALEFSLGLKQGIKLWVLDASTEGQFKIQMKWDNK